MMTSDPCMRVGSPGCTRVVVVARGEKEQMKHDGICEL